MSVGDRREQLGGLGGHLRLGHRAAVAALELLGERGGQRLGDELGLPHREPVGGTRERPGHAQGELLAEPAVVDDPGHPAQRLGVGLGEHRLVVGDVLEAHRVPEPPGGEGLDARALGHLAPSHRGGPAEQHALDPLGDVVGRCEVGTGAVEERGASPSATWSPVGRPTCSADIGLLSGGQRARTWTTSPADTAHTPSVERTVSLPASSTPVATPRRTTPPGSCTSTSRPTVAQAAT